MRLSLSTLVASVFLLSSTPGLSVSARLNRRCQARHAVSPIVLPAASPTITATVLSSTSATKSAASAVTTTKTVTVTTQRAAANNVSSTARATSATSTSTSAKSTTTAKSSYDPNVRTYSVKESFEGDNFFDGFNFDSFPDPTHGNVNYVPGSRAWNEGLISIQDDGTAVIKVDNSKTVPAGGNRDSVRITSKNSYTSGLIVLDVESMPFGCGVWPAFWTVGENWPNGGEIDIVEGVNNAVNAQYTLHTSPGCQLDTSFVKSSGTKRRLQRRMDQHSNSTTGRHPNRRDNAFSTMAFTGRVLTANCDATQNGNTGCGVQDPSAKSYGSALNEGGGGVFATLLDNNGVAIWFFPRNAIPDDLSSKSPQPATWGSPKAFWSSSQCPTKSFFGAQRIVINTTLCGDWAGAAYSSAGCPGTCAQRVADPRNFDTAQWKIRSVMVYD